MFTLLVKKLKIISVLVIALILIGGCSKSEPPPLPESCQQQLVSNLEGGETITNAVRTFMDCAGLSVFDIINLLV